MWIEWTVATRFLCEGKTQSTPIRVAISLGVGVIVLLTSLITGRQGHITDRTLGTQAHINAQPTEETNRILTPTDGSVQLGWKTSARSACGRSTTGSRCATYRTRCRR